jgi:TctA family transporter
LPFDGPSTAGSFAGTTYQQVYLGTLFGSGQIRVTAVEFFTAPGNGSREIASANYTLSMSTTTKAVEALDTANLPSNIGANLQTVFSAALGAGAIVDSHLRIASSNPMSMSELGAVFLLRPLSSTSRRNARLTREGVLTCVNDIVSIQATVASSPCDRIQKS